MNADGPGAAASRHQSPHFGAAIFDLDGVVTQTSKVHAAAWKETFDAFLQARAAAGDEPFEPFEIATDYVQYVDGRPRYEGVRTFLRARGIELEAGCPDDPPDAETICGLGNRKNERFRALVQQGGVEVYEPAVSCIRDLRAAGVRVAVATSSKNGRMVLERAGLLELFDARIDGVVSAELDLAGKPAPDIFLEATRRLGVEPERALMFEDAISGVQAGHRGGFGLVIGVDREHQAAALRDSGADVVVASFEVVDVPTLDTWYVQNTTGLPDAFERWSDIEARLRGRRLAVFLDYDGTLSPIVDKPDQAFMAEHMRAAVKHLAAGCPVAVVSGRARETVMEFVQLDELYYAGSHGFDISGPNTSIQWQQDESLLEAVSAVTAELERRLAGIEGASIEAKGFSTAVHYRLVAPADVPTVERRVEEVLAAAPELEKTHGKKVLELRPRVDWHKGKAVLWLLEALGLDGDDVLPIYVGDDVTDEDAFAAVADRGLGILVSDRPRPSAASYAVRSTDDVQRLLERIAEVAADAPAPTPGRAERAERAAAGGDTWTLVYDDFDPDAEGLREALCTLGNGTFATRGASEFARADDVHYPGTYLAGGFNRLDTEVAGHVVTNEDFVNFPNWLLMHLRIEDGDWFNHRTVDLLDYRQELDMRQGLLTRKVRFRDRHGRETEIRTQRFVHMDKPNLAGLELSITPRNWSGTVTVRSELDGSVINAGVARYSQLNSKHLHTLDMGEDGDDTVWLLVQTRQSRIDVAEAARTRVFVDDDGARAVERRTYREQELIGQELSIPVAEGKSVRIEKIVTLYSSRDRGICEPSLDARESLRAAGSFDELFASHALNWGDYWDRYDIAMEPAGPEQRMVRLHIFHLLQCVSMNSVDLDVGVPARGLHGEAYRGHIFWDELFIFPFFDLRTPEITRSLLMYRHRRLDKARALARDAGHSGAMYPWQSGSNGSEETQLIHLNPRSGRWDPDHSHLQRHVNIAIAYNTWLHWVVTGDRVFLAIYGTEILLEIARFWASITTHNPATGRYEIRGVMGPDEYHEKYPEAEESGLVNNAYTNVMVVWLFERALELLDNLTARHRRELCRRMSISDDELTRWRDITTKMTIPFHGDGIISQFEGYDELAEFDWDGYRARYGDIARLDRILKAEGDSPDRYKVSKQADVCMLFYLLPTEQLRHIFLRLGYPFDDDMVRRNVEYYMARTSHGSTLSQVVHASVFDRIDRDRAWALFRDALRSDIEDIQGGTTKEGIHLGAMAGTVDTVLRHYAGVQFKGELISFDPMLPTALTRLRFNVRHRNRWYRVEVAGDSFELTAEPARGGETTVLVRNQPYAILPGETLRLTL
ncbi:trehalose-phosphatase [Haliangium sp.]|uniref:trehalose-phosphatase n=1 Tax=Haliangium sp. TaxID=2663208 RepID=UPI003D0CB9F5